jgi:ADP-ribosyl-[dinitrogen reductase] hydrolase
LTPKNIHGLLFESIYVNLVLAQTNALNIVRFLKKGDRMKLFDDELEMENYESFLQDSVTKSHRSARTVGAIVGMAVGDALGAPFEFGPALPKKQVIEMTGGGTFGWGVGEWTDDTQMALPILQACAQGQELASPETQTNIVQAWRVWALTAKDVGTQTSTVLSGISSSASSVEARAYAKSAYRGGPGGTGALMRTAPVVLQFLDYADDIEEEELGATAREIASLTHAGPYASEAVAIWTKAMRRAILFGELSLDTTDPEWIEIIADAESGKLGSVRDTFGVVGAFKVAWDAVSTTASYEDAVRKAIRFGGDTDTTAAIAGALAGAYYGVSAIPARWRRVLNGSDGLTYRDLVEMTFLAKNGGIVSGSWPGLDRFEPGPEGTVVGHPHDGGVWMGSLAAIDVIDVDAIVSLSRVGRKQHPTITPDEFWIVDYPDQTLNLDYVLTDAANTIAELRAEGKTVLVHCFAAHSRTPSVSALYSALHLDVPIDQALADVISILPDASPQPFLVDAVKRISNGKARKKK